MFQILIIDDDRTVQTALTKMLEKQGYEVLSASNGEDGLSQAQQFRPAMIICDWMMPRLNGLEVCRRIKADPTLSTTFFILLTSLGSVADRVKGLDAGADDFIAKPIEQNELNARVRAGLRSYQVSYTLQTQKQILETELREAADYVRSLLPPPMTEPLTINSRFIPSRRLGGDCFDYYWLDPDYLAIYLLDTAGHGLGATLPSISVLNLLRSRAFPAVNYYQPSDVLRVLNDTFQMTDQNDKYFTIWYGVYNCVTRKLTYASAGHPPAVLLSGKPTTTQARQLTTSGVPVGMFPDATYFDCFCNIEEFSTLYIFSDGVYEIKQPNSTVWGLDDFVELLKDGHNTSKEFNLDKVLNYLLALNRKDAFDDDLSLLQINFI